MVGPVQDPVLAPPACACGRDLGVRCSAELGQISALEYGFYSRCDYPYRSLHADLVSAGQVGYKVQRLCHGHIFRSTVAWGIGFYVQWELDAFRSWLGFRFWGTRDALSSPALTMLVANLSA